MDHYKLGITLQKQGKLKEAIASYQRALQLKSDQHLAHQHLGTALQKQGKLETDTQKN
ncbi:MAG: tetratricopeptide repeat protein [Moorea sp. SIO2B7]|nr:tetratricopeptide repeat protein [Moorena sp. SIO2B7]